MQPELAEKTRALLRFLEASASLRRKRVVAYDSGDRVLWFHRIPQHRDECRSPFLDGRSEQFPDQWLEVRKPRRPARPPAPDLVRDWIPAGALDIAGEEPELLREITVPPPSESADGPPQPSVVLRLDEHPEVEDTWLEYLVYKWEPWSREMLEYQRVQEVYETVDFMRRRLEETEELYELVLAVGLVQWKDPDGQTIKRHLLTAPAEISLDAARGVLTVTPAASFEGFHHELDMLAQPPSLPEAELNDALEELDVEAWDRWKVAAVLRIIANRASPNAQVHEDAAEPLKQADDVLRVLYAPALVLRQRRSRAYDDMVRGFLKEAEGPGALSVTLPWRKFVLEGEAPPAAQDGPPLCEPRPLATERLYFPLPTNDQQRQIAEAIEGRPYVLVKGPPGTGKSHTIANLICHLLAVGERVLVTAHAPRALAVLRGLLPSGIPDLCVTAIGSTREDQRLLEESIQSILAHRDRWPGAEAARAKIDRLEEKRRRLEAECAELDRRLRSFREAETHRPSLFGVYEGTAAQIARQLEQEQRDYGWFPEVRYEDGPCPLNSEQLAYVADFHATLTDERLADLRLATGDLQLPEPKRFESAIEAEQTARRKESLVGTRDVEPEKLAVLQDLGDEEIEVFSDFVRAVDSAVERLRPALGETADRIVQDVVAGSAGLWTALLEDLRVLVARIEELLKELGSADVTVPDGRQLQRLFVDARRRFEHLAGGRWKGFWILTPSVIRQTRYIEQECLIDGQPVRDVRQLETLLVLLEIRRALDRWFRAWPTPPQVNRGGLKQVARQCFGITRDLASLLGRLAEAGDSALARVPHSEKSQFHESPRRRQWLDAAELELARRAVQAACAPFDRWLNEIRSLGAEGVHPCLRRLAEAIERRDAEAWREAWQRREEIREEQRRLSKYESLIRSLLEACPALQSVLEGTRGKPDWRPRIAQLDRAWAWSAARSWLRDRSDPAHLERLTSERRRLQDNLEETIQELVRQRAWKAFFDRLDDQTAQNLIAWGKAIRRVGKGTGKFASKNRRTARKYLMECIPKIPAWIMPLHRLWDTIRPEPGLFDTVIVDEASQAGIDSLILLLLARRIIVVGDDKQNSPERVGVREEDISRLTREHLQPFHFKDEFRPDASLYDHAERAFGNVISLREHFRCVPEIIRFSNDLCYRNAPLIPLRQPPPERLPPLHASFVPGGAVQGEGSRIRNEEEARAIVETIEKCCADEAYENKTMGVIVLQGHAQVELIEQMLAERLDPREREERKLRCGVPASFQGDERDVIFLSMVAAPNYRFRALTGIADQRRFNVAMSRARDQLWLFHSVELHDLSRDDLRWKALNFVTGPQPSPELYEELDRLEKAAARTPRVPGDQPEPYESWFEVDVALELLRRKYRVRPQYEVAGYRIDIVVEGLQNRLAVECDGDAWHGPEAYDHDMARQRQLERVGWTFVRIRESEFYADRTRAIARVVEECERLAIFPVGQEAEIEETHEIGGEAGEEPAGTLLGEGAEEPEPSDVQSGPFTGYSPECRFPDPRTAAAAKVREALRSIIEKDGPLTKASLFRLYVEGCPSISRAGKTVKTRLNHELYWMERSGEIVIEHELGGRSFESQVVRHAGTPRVRERPAGARDLLDIPPSELMMLLDRLGAGMSDDLFGDEFLYRQILKHYGFTRLTSPRRRYLAKVLMAYRTQVRQSR